MYEKRLIEAYITENGTEPTTGAPLSPEDLLDIQSSYIVRPRPPELTSIPSLLGAFQQEWDALALEVFTLQQNLAQTRQELSTALYQNDAAVRVIARLTQERDAAREALRNINVSGGAGQTQTSNGDAMHIDNSPLPESIIAKIESTQAGLMKTRRKRPVPAEWATPETISIFKPTKSIETSGGDASFLDIRQQDSMALVGSRAGGAYAVQPSDGSIRQTLPDTESVTAGHWFGTRCALATASGQVFVVDNGEQVASFRSHSEAVTDVALHPTGDILASVSLDKTYTLYDLEQNEVLTQVRTDSGMSISAENALSLTVTEITCTSFHPDGHLLATGTKTNQVQIFDVKTGAVGGTFELSGPATAVCFSENGTWLATASEGSTAVTIWDLRKAGGEAMVHQLDTGDVINSLDWDYTAQYLLIGGPAGVTVKQYAKSTKLWSEPFKMAVPSVSVCWGDSAQSIWCLSKDGVVTALSST